MSNEDGEVERVEVSGWRQLGDGARFLLGDLGAQEVADDALRLVPALEPVTIASS